MITINISFSFILILSLSLSLGFTKHAYSQGLSEPGPLQLNNGDSYHGGMKNKLFHGYGVLKFTNGTLYKGYFENGRYHGKGYLVYPSGNTYEGNFNNGRKSGKGKFTYKMSKIYKTYEGDFLNDKYEGEGQMKLANGESYTGSFKFDRYHGKGTYTFSDGTQLIGKWINNTQSGIFQRINKKKKQDELCEFIVDKLNATNSILPAQTYTIINSIDPCLKEFTGKKILPIQCAQRDFSPSIRIRINPPKPQLTSSKAPLGMPPRPPAYEYPLWPTMF